MFFNVFPLSATSEYAMLAIEHLFKKCGNYFFFFLSLLIFPCGIIASVSFSRTTGPTLEKVQCEIKRLPPAQWAHLDTKEFQEIVFVYADNPHQLFIRHYKFNDM
jgi:hypothetical protein